MNRLRIRMGARVLFLAVLCAVIASVILAQQGTTLLAAKGLAFVTGVKVIGGRAFWMRTKLYHDWPIENGNDACDSRRC